MATRICVLYVIACGTISLQFVSPVHATNYRIEPDDYTEGAVLNDVNPIVDLRIYNGFAITNFPAQFGVFPDPEIIPVTANENADIFGGYFTSTGTKSFGEANVPFFTEASQLGMRFLTPVSQVTIDFIGRNSLQTAIGVLQIYTSQGTLLDTFSSSPVTAHHVATLTFTRPSADIGYARAFSSPDADSFGTLDNLRFVTSTSTITGDFNSDGKVNAADYVVWRNGLGTTYTQNHYAQWRQNFGAGSGSSSVDPSSVPEPTCVGAAVAIGLLATAFRFRRDFRLLNH